MEKLFYPHFFISRKKAAFGFRFQIFRNVLLEGDDMKQAYEMTVEALGLA